MITGLAHGCFDLIHYGHIGHLRAAKEHCDWLTVCVTPDAYVNKGPTRPIFTAEQRATVLRALKPVDEVFIGTGPDVAIRALQSVRPQVYIKGSDYRTSDNPNFVREREFCEEYGIKLIFTDEDSFSSTKALERLRAACS